jgi:hypothetical protein
LERTYQIEKSPEKPLTWAEYERVITSDWDALLNREPSPSEQEVQRFLERHPSMVPGAFGLTGLQSGHYPMLCGVIARPPLPSYNCRVPDFMWLSQSSDTEQPVLIEIEAPSKPWFTRRGRPTHQFNQALDQIVEWKNWFDVAHNVRAFKEFYRFDRSAWMKRSFRPAYLLIYGRRAEANADPRLTRKRTTILPDLVFSMTYDRLCPDPKANDLVCLMDDRAGPFRVVSVPATLRWTPSLAEERAFAREWDVAIEGNRNISPQRKEFLIKRLPYWEEWVRREAKGLLNSPDEE